MPQPEQVRALAEQLVALYDGISRRLLDETLALLDAWPTEARAARLGRLRDLEDLVRTLTDTVDEQALRWVVEDLPAAYLLGAIAVTGDLAGVDLAGIDLDALAVLATDTYQGLLAATTGVRDSTKQLIRALAREHVADKLVRGATAVQAGRELRRALEDRGIVAVTYADGSRHRIGEYAAMLVRTKTAEAYSTGNLAGADAAGAGWVEVFDGPSCFAGHTRLGAYGGLLQMVRQWYVGPAVTLTVGARELTVGPNHPVLTTTGWRTAETLSPGDQVLYDSRSHVAVPLAADDLEQMPRAEDLFVALSQGRGGVRRSLPRADDLHGDAEHGQGEVEVVAAERGLLLEGDAGCLEQTSELDFARTDADLQPLSADGEFARLARGPRPTARRGVSGGDLLLAAVGVETVPLGQGSASLAAVAGRSAEAGAPPRHVGAAVPAGECGTDRLPGTPRDCEPGLAGDGEATPAAVGAAFAGRGGAADSTWRSETVLAVRHHDFQGWMYDATSVDGALSGDSIVLSNCGWRTHDDKDKAHGTLRRVADARKHVTAHPNCTRAFGARVDVTSAAEARRARPSTTPAQILDQAAVEASRELAVARRAARRAAQGQVAARAGRLLADEGNRITSPRHAARVAARQVRLDRAARLRARQDRLAARSASRST